MVLCSNTEYVGNHFQGVQMSNLRTKMPLDMLVVELNQPKLTGTVEKCLDRLFHSPPCQAENTE